LIFLYFERQASIPLAIRTDMLWGQQRPSKFEEVGNEVRAWLWVAYFVVDVGSGDGAEPL
jgi:hypothetical protein